MKALGYCLFDTPLGPCGIAWNEQANAEAPYAVTAFQLPEATAQLTESRIAAKAEATEASVPPSQIAATVERVRKHLSGETQEFRDIPVDLGGVPPFARQVYEAARKIPAGKTLTYAGLADALGRPAATRGVGRALGRNPIPLIIPCHRILAAHGKPGGFSAFGGRATKAKLLAIEGTVVNLCLELTSD